jgi:hypothetical protein
MGPLALVFLKYVGKTPSLAGCAKCQLKFFTPQHFLKNPEAADEYLRIKFSQHECKWESFEETRGVVPTRRMRVVKSTDDAFLLGVCEACSMRFRAHVYHPQYVQEAEINIQQKFVHHRCKRQNGNESRVPRIGMGAHGSTTIIVLARHYSRPFQIRSLKVTRSPVHCASPAGCALLDKQILQASR